MSLLTAILSGIGAAIGLGTTVSNQLSQAEMDRLSGLLSSQNQLEALQGQVINSYSTYANALSQQLNLKGSIQSNRLQLKQTDANLTAYGQAMARMQSQFDFGRQSMQIEGRNQYYGLMNTYQNLGVGTAAKGQTGGSASLIEKMARASIVDYVGSDMKLDAHGGLYGMSLQEYFLDSMATKTEMQAQMEIERESWDIYYDTLRTNMDNLDQAEKNAAVAKENIQKDFGLLMDYYGKDVAGAEDRYTKSYEELQSLISQYEKGGKSSADLASMIESKYAEVKLNYEKYAEIKQQQDDAVSPFIDALGEEYLGEAASYSAGNSYTDAFLGMSSRMEGELGNSLKETIRAEEQRIREAEEAAKAAEEAKRRAEEAARQKAEEERREALTIPPGNIDKPEVSSGPSTPGSDISEILHDAETDKYEDAFTSLIPQNPMLSPLQNMNMVNQTPTSPTSPGLGPFLDDNDDDIEYTTTEDGYVVYTTVDENGTKSTTKILESIFNKKQKQKK